MRAWAMMFVAVSTAGCASATNPDGGLPTGSCYDDQVVIGQDLRNIYEGGGGPCSKHADCVLLDIDVPCQSSCPAAVLGSKESELRARIVSYGERACPLIPGCVSAGSCIGYEAAICADAGYCARGLLDGGAAE